MFPASTGNFPGSVLVQTLICARLSGLSRGGGIQDAPSALRDPRDAVGQHGKRTSGKAAWVFSRQPGMPDRGRSGVEVGKVWFWKSSICQLRAPCQLSARGND